jgi:peptidoglycan/LPS O-acetylase OafA/YrhL
VRSAKGERRNNLTPLDTSRSRTRFHFLDSIRGLAAVYVVFYHLTSGYFHSTGHYKWAQLGHYSVSVFIVLSGFCLMLPIARDGTRASPAGVSGFIKRRARRILPPYYAALLFSAALWLLDTRFISGSAKPEWYGDTSFASWSSHVLLLHNSHPDWNIGINGALWTIATEWQIYFLFALLLLPVCRRFGWVVCLATAFGVGLLPHFVLPTSRNFDWACPWYLGLFGLGMLAAELAVNRSRKTEALAHPLLVCALWLSVLTAAFLKPRHFLAHEWRPDVMIGCACAAMILMCANSAQGVRPNWLLRVLESKPLVELGKFSYSLYLIHLPVIAILASFVWNIWKIPSQFAQSFYVWMGVCLSIAVAYGFHLLFEKPFLTTASPLQIPSQQNTVAPLWLLVHLKDEKR